MAYVFSHGYSIRSGFPHSDIYGSKLVCQLPVAFRRLPRPSSPVIAKASTTCTCSLDPITSLSHRQSLQVEFSRCAVFQLESNNEVRIILRYIDTITTRIASTSISTTLPLSKLLASSRLLKNDSRYSFLHHSDWLNRQWVRFDSFSRTQSNIIHWGSLRE